MEPLTKPPGAALCAHLFWSGKVVEAAEEVRLLRGRRQPHVYSKICLSPSPR
jgi:hypothetical protein